MLRLETLLLLSGLFLGHTLTFRILLLILFTTLLFLLFFTTHLKIIMKLLFITQMQRLKEYEYDEMMPNAIMPLYYT